MGTKSSEVSVAHYGGYSPIRLSLVVEVDVSVEHDLAVNILDDVVAVEPIAVLIKIINTLCSSATLHAQDCLANLLRIQNLGVVDGERKHVNRVVGPRPAEVGRRLIGLLVFESEPVCRRTRFPPEVGHDIRAVECCSAEPESGASSR